MPPAPRFARCRSCRCSRPSPICRAAPGHHARGARRAAHPPLDQLAGRRAGGDDRLFGFQQGRRLRRLELGAGQGAVATDPRRREKPARRSPSSTAAAARSPAAARRPAAPSPPSRPARSAAGSASPSRARWSPSNMPIAARRSIRWSCSPRACSSMR